MALVFLSRNTVQLVEPARITGCMEKRAARHRLSDWKIGEPFTWEAKEPPREFSHESGLIVYWRFGPHVMAPANSDGAPFGTRKFGNDSLGNAPITYELMADQYSNRRERPA